MSFPPLFFQLQQEAFLVQSSFSVGLTEMRGSHLGVPGRFYTAFFQVSIGIERLCKLVLILDHLAKNQLQAPGVSVVRSFGHDLAALVGRSGVVSNIRTLPVAGSVSEDILNFLGAFAKTTRYANLDSLATGQNPRNILAEWERVIDRVVRENVSDKRLRSLEARAKFAAGILSEHADVVAHDLSNRPLSLADWFHLPNLHDEAGKYVVWELVRLVAPLIEAVIKVGWEADKAGRKIDPELMLIPAMSEFFGFLWPERNYVIRKRRWP